jgi:NADH-quinone oxidoreductase subunit C
MAAPRQPERQAAGGSHGVSELSHEPVLQQFPDAEWDEAAGAVIVPLGQARTVAEWLLGQGVDYCSNVTGVDYLEREVKEKITNDAGEVETVTRTEPARIDVVYHLYSMQNKTGPLVLKQRTGRDNAEAESLTPVWRSCDLQEREVFDLFGVNFKGHPDQRRILMWDEFEGHPMRKDYTEPFDYEWEPTPHNEILEKHQKGKVIV